MFFVSYFTILLCSEIFSYFQLVSGEFEADVVVRILNLGPGPTRHHCQLPMTLTGLETTMKNQEFMEVLLTGLDEHFGKFRHDSQDVASKYYCRYLRIVTKELTSEFKGRDITDVHFNKPPAWELIMGKYQKDSKEPEDVQLKVSCEVGVTRDYAVPPPVLYYSANKPVPVQALPPPDQRGGGAKGGSMKEPRSFFGEVSGVLFNTKTMKICEADIGRKKFWMYMNTGWYQMTYLRVLLARLNYEFNPLKYGSKTSGIGFTCDMMSVNMDKQNYEVKEDIAFLQDASSPVTWDKMMDEYRTDGTIPEYSQIFLRCLVRGCYYGENNGRDDVKVNEYIFTADAAVTILQNSCNVPTRRFQIGKINMGKIISYDMVIADIIFATMNYAEDNLGVKLIHPNFDTTGDGKEFTISNIAGDAKYYDTKTTFELNEDFEYSLPLYTKFIDFYGIVCHENKAGPNKGKQYPFNIEISLIIIC